MSGSPRRAKPIAALKDEFRRAAATHGDATTVGDAKVANAAYRAMARTVKQLKLTAASGEGVFLELMQHENISVRSWAAAHALAFAPDLALRTLGAVARRKGLVGFSAEMMIELWLKSEFKPPFR